jgi:MerR family transcriptional regulator/heat shock protein HspR
VARKKKSKGGGDEPRYTISVVAERLSIHPQTLRLYEREGLLTPGRSEGNTRLYSESDLERLELILRLTREMGVNIAGVEIILHMRERMEMMNSEIQRLLSFFREELSRRLAEVEGARGGLIPTSMSRVIQIAPEDLEDEDS